MIGHSLQQWTKLLTMVMVTENIIIANIDYATNGFSSLVEASLCMNLQCYQRYLSKASCAYNADLDGCHLFWDCYSYPTTQHAAIISSLTLFITCDNIPAKEVMRKNVFWLRALQRCSVSWSEDMAVGREGIMTEGDGWLFTQHQHLEIKEWK